MRRQQPAQRWAEPVFIEFPFTPYAYDSVQCLLDVAVELPPPTTETPEPPLERRAPQREVQMSERPRCVKFSLQIPRSREFRVPLLVRGSVLMIGSVVRVQVATSLAVGGAQSRSSVFLGYGQGLEDVIREEGDG